KLNPETGEVESAGTGAGHLGSYQLVRYLPHGRACAVLNPYYTVLFGEATEKQNRVLGEILQRAGFVEGVDLGKLGGRRLAEVVAGGMIRFSKSIGFPTTLKEAGVPPEQVEVMAEASKDPQVRMKLKNMPVPLDVEDVDRFIRPTLLAAYEGDFDLVPELRK
ncbi:MAG: iron-containing alcohol dehydrogenase, partial [Candidatus Latescibacterota bacterium]